MCSTYARCSGRETAALRRRRRPAVERSSAHGWQPQPHDVDISRRAGESATAPSDRAPRTGCRRLSIAIRVWRLTVPGCDCMQVSPVDTAVPGRCARELRNERYFACACVRACLLARLAACSPCGVVLIAFRWLSRLLRSLGAELSYLHEKFTLRRHGGEGVGFFFSLIFALLAESQSGGRSVGPSDVSSVHSGHPLDICFSLRRREAISGKRGVRDNKAAAEEEEEEEGRQQKQRAGPQKSKRRK